MLIALNFIHGERRKGIWIKSEDLDADVWEKLSGNLVKQSLGSRWIHVVSSASWSMLVNIDGGVFRARGASRYLTGAPLKVSEPTIESILRAIDADEITRLAVPMEGPGRAVRHTDITFEAHKLLGASLSSEVLMRSS